MIRLTDIPRGIRWASAAMVALLLVLFLWGVGERRAGARADARADSLATELAAEQARALGFAVALSTAQEGWIEELAGRDSTIAALERSLAATRARPVAHAIVVAEASGSVETPAAAATPDSAHADVVDGPLSAALAYWSAPPRFALDWSVSIEAELVAALGADRRLLVAARPLRPDPRVQLRIEELIVDLPEPRPPGPAWLCAAVSLGSGALLALEPAWWSAVAAGGGTLLACR